MTRRIEIETGGSVYEHTGIFPPTNGKNSINSAVLVTLCIN